MFLVREPWPSRATGTDITSGRLEKDETLLLVSRMNDGGVVFADGIEQDRLGFAWGRTLRLSVAEQRLHFVPGRHSAAPRPRPQTSRVRAMPTPEPAAKPVPKPPAQAKPPASARPAAPTRRPRRLAIIVALMVAIGLAGRACDWLNAPDNDAAPVPAAPAQP